MTSTWWRTDAVDWQTGGWQLQLRGDEIADIRHRGSLVLRAVRAVVRDRGWQTVPAVVRKIDRGADTLVLTLAHEGYGALVTSMLTVRNLPGELVVEWDAVNEVDFDTCRTGLVVLHPAAEAGRTVTVTHADGSEEETSFPRTISPHQPMRDIRALRIDGGTSIVFTGDVFEMEDQRNWTDASFKTYSRPLDLPYPYLLRAGEVVRQSISISEPRDSPNLVVDRPPSVIELTSGGRFPDIGVEASTAPDPVPTSVAGVFRVVELDLSTAVWGAALRRAASDGLPLDVRIVSDGDGEHASAAATALAELPVLRVGVFDSELHVTTRPLAKVFAAAMRAAGVRAPLVGGARSHFTELNREHVRIPSDLESLLFTVTPLFHALDTEQLVEALAMQRIVADQAVDLAAGRNVHIGPVSLRPRFNNVATTPVPVPNRKDLRDGYGSHFAGSSDARQESPELAAWLIGSASALAVRGVSSLSWFETWGPRGFESDAGRTPAAAALEALVDLCGSELLSGESPDGLIWAIGARIDGADIVLAANVGRSAREIDVRLPGGSSHLLTLRPGAWTRFVR